MAVEATKALSNKIIPKEMMSAYQRWELNSFDEPGSPGRQGVEPAPPVNLPTAEELELIQKQAYQEGYATGYHDGKTTALTDAERIGQILRGLEEAMVQLDQQVAQEVGDLAIEIAKKMLSQALTVKPELILPVVRDAMNALPVSGHHPHLLLNPEDALLVRSYLEAELARSGYKVIDDIRIQRGGCRIENANTEIDATMETRWKMIVAAIGREDDWLK